MKIRTDFVTNSSSASYILEVQFYADNGQDAKLFLAVSPETCKCEDGEMRAYDIGLYPECRDGKPFVGSHEMSSASSIDELIDWIAEDATIDQFYPRVHCIGWPIIKGKTVYIDPDLKLVSYSSLDELKKYIKKDGGKLVNDPGAAGIIISDKDKSLYPNMYNEIEFIVIYDGERISKDEDREDLLGKVSVAEVCPKSVGTFKKKCREAGLTMSNLKRVFVKDAIMGWGDSGMWVDKEVLAEYKDRYLSAETDEEKAAVVEETVEFMHSKPIVEVEDYGSWLDCETQVVLEDNDKDVIREEIMKYFHGEGTQFWLGQYSSLFNIDVKSDTLEKEKILVLLRKW